MNLIIRYLYCIVVTKSRIVYYLCMKTISNRQKQFSHSLAKRVVPLDPPLNVVSLELGDQAWRNLIHKLC